MANYHEYTEDDFNAQPWSNDFLNADPQSKEFQNAMNEADNYYGPEWTDNQLNQWGIKFENAIESNPVDAAEALPEGSDIQKEAVQAIDGGADAEVRNDVVEDFIKQQEEPGHFLNNNKGLLGTSSDEFDSYIQSLESQQQAQNQQTLNPMSEDEKKLFKAAEALGMDTDTNLHSGWYGEWIPADKSMNKIKKVLDKVPKHGTSPSDLNIDDLKRAAKQKNSTTKNEFGFTRSQARAELNYQLGKGDILETLPTPYWDEERFNEFEQALKSRLSSVDSKSLNAGDTIKHYSKLMANLNRAHKQRQYLNAKEGFDLDNYNNTSKGILGPKSSSIDWDKVKVYEPGEDPIEWVKKDDYDPQDEENLNYDYEEGVGAPGVLKNKDEDFAGPDELPAQIYDNSDFQPKQLPAVINDGLPAEQYYEPAYDTSKYNFNWSWEDISDPAEIDNQVDEDDSIPEEDKEEVKKQRHMMWAKHHVDKVDGSSNAGSTFKGDYSTNGSMGFGGGKGIMSGSGGIGSFMARPKAEKPVENKVEEVKSNASKAPTPVETETKATAPSVKANPTTSNRISNGGFNSGSVDKRGNSLIKVNKVSLPNGEANNQPDSFEGSLGTTTNNLRDSRIALLEQRIKQLDPELQEHFGFSTKYKHTEYKDTPLDECSGGQLQEIEDILEACGV